MTNEQATEFVNKINEALALEHDLAAHSSLRDERAGARAELVCADIALGERRRREPVRRVLRQHQLAARLHEAHVGDFIKVRTYLKPAMFKGEHCYLHIDDEANILEHFHKTGVD